MNMHKTIAMLMLSIPLLGCGDDPLTEIPPPIDGETPSVNNIYILHSTQEANSPFEFWDSWGSGSTFTTQPDADYREILRIEPGNNWDTPTSNIAWGIDDVNAIDLRNITHANFKVQANSTQSVEVAIVTTTDEYKQSYSLSSGNSLANGWVQMQVPITPSEHTTWFALTFANSGAVQLADIYLSQEDSNDDGQQEQSQFVLIDSQSQDSDLIFSDDTVQDWSTGTVFDAHVSYLDKLAWKVTSGTKTAEEGNWGAVLVFNGGVEQDLNEHNYLDVSIATNGGFERYAVAIASNGVSREQTLPIDDANNSNWQQARIDLNQFALTLSEIDSIAIMGVGGTAGVSNFYVTDFQFSKTKSTERKPQPQPQFIISHSSQESHLIGADYNEWSTGTIMGTEVYDGLQGWSLQANGGWGAVLAIINENNSPNNPISLLDLSNHTNLQLKVAATAGFSSYKVFISSNIDGKPSDNVIAFNLKTPEQWNNIDINLSSYGINLANVEQLAIYGEVAEGTPTLYVTDVVAYDNGIVQQNEFKDYGEQFTFISAADGQSDLAFDNSSFINQGNAGVNDWSTGSILRSDANHLGSNAWQVTRGDGWGAVLAFTGDTYGEILPFDFDIKDYSNLKLKLTSDSGLNEFTIAFNTTKGASYEHPLSLSSSSDWNNIELDMSTLPLDCNDIMQIAIFSANGTSGDSFYVTDMVFSK